MNAYVPAAPFICVYRKPEALLQTLNRCERVCRGYADICVWL